MNDYIFLGSEDLELVCEALDGAAYYLAKELVHITEGTTIAAAGPDAIEMAKKINQFKEIEAAIKQGLSSGDGVVARIGRVAS